MDWTIIFRNPPPLSAQRQIPTSVLENPPLSGRLLYDMACQLYRSQEESLRAVQQRASHLLNVSILVLTGGIVTFVNLSHTFWLGAFASLLFLILGCVVLVWALRPIAYAEQFSPWCITQLPEMIKSDDQFLVYLALSYDALIQSVHRALEVTVARVLVASVLLIAGLTLFAVTLVLR